MSQELTELQRMIILYNHRHKAVHHAAQCHEYMYNLMYKISALLLIPGSIIQIAIIATAIFITTTNVFAICMNGAVTILAFIYKQTDLAGKMASHKASRILAEDLIEDMDFKCISASNSIERMTIELKSINDRIASFRVTEPSVPLWVKEKFPSN